MRKNRFVSFVVRNLPPWFLCFRSSVPCVLRAFFCKSSSAWRACFTARTALVLRGRAAAALGHELENLDVIVADLPAVRLVVGRKGIGVVGHQVVIGLHLLQPPLPGLRVRRRRLLLFLRRSIQHATQRPLDGDPLPVAASRPGRDAANRSADCRNKATTSRSSACRARGPSSDRSRRRPTRCRGPSRTRTIGRTRGHATSWSICKAASRRGARSRHPAERADRGQSCSRSDD